MRIFHKSFLTTLLLAITIHTSAQIKKENSAIDHKWVAGAGLGNIAVIGDVQSMGFNVCGNLHLYKPVKNWFGINLNFNYGVAKGLNGLLNENFAKNTALAPFYAAPIRNPNGTYTIGYVKNGVITPATQADVVFYNYKSSITSLSVNAVFTLPVPFSGPVVGFHAAPGFGILSYKTNINALNGNSIYAQLFKNTAAMLHSSVSEKRKELKKKMDKSYETRAQSYNGKKPYTQHLNFGATWYINNKLELGLNREFIFTKSDLIDGQQWQEHAWGDAVLTRDYDFIVLHQLNLRYRF